MARKTTGTVTSRSKKTVQPAAVETSSVIEPVVEKAARKSEKTATVTAINRGAVSLNLEDAIRRRAYELYLERRATAGADQGDENQDWLLAEREVRSRDGGQGQHTA
jgi:acyl-CoA reductase-like NAD-dependent aldehyde dehydrogenase